MKASDKMKITIVDLMGREVTGGFIVPEDATRDVLQDDERILEFGRKVIAEYFDCADGIEKHYEKMLDKCTCFWKDRPLDERIVNTCHSSTCPCLEGE